MYTCVVKVYIDCAVIIEEHHITWVPRLPCHFYKGVFLSGLDYTNSGQFSTWFFHSQQLLGLIIVNSECVVWHNGRAMTLQLQLLFIFYLIKFFGLVSHPLWPKPRRSPVGRLFSQWQYRSLLCVYRFTHLLTQLKLSLESKQPRPKIRSTIILHSFFPAKPSTRIRHNSCVAMIDSLPYPNILVNISSHPHQHIQTRCISTFTLRPSGSRVCRNLSLWHCRGDLITVACPSIEVEAARTN